MFWSAPNLQHQLGALVPAAAPGPRRTGCAPRRWSAFWHRDRIPILAEHVTVPLNERSDLTCRPVLASLPAGESMIINVSEAVDALDKQGVENLLGAVALLVAVASFLYAWRSHRRLEQRELALRTSAVYMELEVQSSAIFAFTAANAETMRRFRCADPPDFDWEAERYEKQRETVLNLYYQTLNLFEVCTRMRRENLFPREVFASWVAWFLELLEDWHFREKWPEIRSNYTVDVRRIFDLGWDIFRHDLTSADRTLAFYAAVAAVMENEKTGECGDIARWPAAMKDVARWERELAEGYSSPGTSPETLLVLRPHFQPA